MIVAKPKPPGKAPVDQRNGKLPVGRLNGVDRGVPLVVDENNYRLGDSGAECSESCPPSALCSAQHNVAHHPLDHDPLIVVRDQLKPFFTEPLAKRAIFQQ